MGNKDSLQPTSPDEQSFRIETQGESRVSLLQQVREGLQDDKRVFFAGEILHLSYGSGWFEAVDIIVAPIKPIYNPENLNKFMDSLISEIPRTSRDKASKDGKKSSFSLGKLYFDETLGEIKREIAITTTAIEPEALERGGVVVGESHKTENKKIKRRTWVRVYPDSNSAQILAEYEQGLEDGSVEFNRIFSYLEHSFSVEQFNKLRKSRNKSPTKTFELLSS